MTSAAKELALTHEAVYCPTTIPHHHQLVYVRCDTEQHAVAPRKLDRFPCCDEAVPHDFIPVQSEAGVQSGNCENCTAPLIGGQKRFCSASCGQTWHAKVRNAKTKPFRNMVSLLRAVQRYGAELETARVIEAVRDLLESEDQATVVARRVMGVA